MLHGPGVISRWSGMPESVLVRTATAKPPAGTTVSEENWPTVAPVCWITCASQLSGNSQAAPTPVIRSSKVPDGPQGTHVFARLWAGR